MSKTIEIKGRKFGVSSYPHPTADGKYACMIYPNDSLRYCYPLCEPHATKPHGAAVEFDSEEEAVEAGVTVIRQDFLRTSDA